MIGRPYKDIARAVISAFLPIIPEKEMQACVDGAYDEKFRSGRHCPGDFGGRGHFWSSITEKTAAFKDMALSILPIC